ncbi:RAQPRD family integrative conjugative element protein [Pseudomonas lini]
MPARRPRAPHAEHSTRYHLNYLRLRKDLQRIRILDYLTPQRAQPRETRQHPNVDRQPVASVRQCLGAQSSSW